MRIPRDRSWSSRWRTRAWILDCEHKASLYARAGVLDYWIVNIGESTLPSSRGPSPSRALRQAPCRDPGSWTRRDGLRCCGARGSDRGGAPLSLTRPTHARSGDPGRDGGRRHGTGAVCAMTARRERCRAKSFAAPAPRLADRVKDRRPGPGSISGPGRLFGRGTERPRYFSASTPAWPIWASCWEVTPETPIPPTI